jgi:hypothetical protein
MKLGFGFNLLVAAKRGVHRLARRQRAVWTQAVTYVSSMETVNHKAEHPLQPTCRKIGLQIVLVTSLI